MKKRWFPVEDGSQSKQNIQSDLCIWPDRWSTLGWIELDFQQYSGLMVLGLIWDQQTILDWFRLCVCHQVLCLMFNEIPAMQTQTCRILGYINWYVNAVQLCCKTSLNQPRWFAGLQTWILVWFGHIWDQQTILDWLPTTYT